MCLESSLSTRKEAVIFRGTCNTRAGGKTKQRKNEKGENQLHIAARSGDLSLVKTLISSGICVNEQDYAGLKKSSLMGLFYGTILYGLQYAWFYIICVI